MKKRILFIINPISGGHNKAAIQRAIFELLDDSVFDICIEKTKFAGHGRELAKNAVNECFDIIVAVGGDGTINEIASQLVHSNTALAIIPSGSGNGLARDLKIPRNYKKAIKNINSLKVNKIDVGRCNDEYFFSLAGVGFDAKVAYQFNRGKKRGFFGYAWACLRDYYTYKGEFFEIQINDQKLSGEYFFITAANATQWGFNVRVAPQASMQDGEFNVCFCKPPNFFSLIPLGIYVLSNKIENSKLVTIINAKKLHIESPNQFYLHLDGDAKDLQTNISLEILPNALSIIAL